VAVGLFTAASGLMPVIVGDHEDKAISRKVFEGIPGPLKLAFYTVIPVLLVWGSFLFAQRVRNWERGGPDDRGTTAKNAKRRFGDFRSGVYMQTLLRDPAAGVMHSMIYFGFLVLLAVTAVLEVNHQLPESAKFLQGRTYEAYAAVGDTAGAIFLIGILWALGRRYVQRPYRIRIKSKPEHAVILGVFFVLGATGFTTEMFRIAGENMPKYEKWSYIGYPLAKLVEGLAPNTLNTWHQINWVTHVLAFTVFLVILPTTMLRHMFTSPLNMYLRDRERPKGAMKAMPNLTETELESFGASVVEDFTWKQLLDTDACTMCGRCTSVCPAHATGKPLDPREIVLKTGEVMAATAPHGHVSPPIGLDHEITISANSCSSASPPKRSGRYTSCKACDEICPVNIEILDKILDMRRYLTLMESNFPTELGTAYRGMENQGNPWGMSQSDRADWAKDLDVDIASSPARPSNTSTSTGSVAPAASTTRTRRSPRRWRSCSSGPASTWPSSDRRRCARVIRRPLRQRVPVPDARHAQHRNARRHGRENHHAVPALLQHAEEQYPTAGRSLRVVHHSQFLEWLIETERLDVSRATLEEARHLPTRATSVATTTCTSLPAT
jgi:ferredoxin/nitrate reductase gamma subunit